MQNLVVSRPPWRPHSVGGGTASVSMVAASGCFLLPAHDSQSYLPFTCPYFPLVMTPPDLDSSTPILVLMPEQFQMQRVAGPSRARRWAPFV